MTAPDSRERGTPEWYAEELRVLAANITGRGVGVCNGAALTIDRLQALARGPHLYTSAEPVKETGDSYARAGGEDGRLLRRLDLMADDGWGAPREAAVQIRALQAEVARLREQAEHLRSMYRNACRELALANEATLQARAALREAVTLLRETGRFLDPRHYAGQIGKLTAFLDKAALNGGQDDA